MKVFINNGLGNVDYTPHVVDGSLNIEDSINVPTLVTFQLSPVTNIFIKPSRSAYVTITSDILAPGGGYGSGKVIATGFITTEPERQFLGLTNQRGAFTFGQYNYNVNVTSDEWLLNCNTVPYIPAFVNQTDSQILAAIANVLMPGFFNTSQMAGGTIVPYYQYDPSQTWSDIAKTFADANRFYYKVINKSIIYQPFGDSYLGISYDDQNQNQSQLAPLELQTAVITIPPVNDCTVLGAVEPQTNWDNYYVGDGFTSNFQLPYQMFRGTSADLLNDAWTETSFNTGQWNVNNPNGTITLVDGNGNALGALNVIQKGNQGVYTPQVNATFIQAVNGLELGGGLNLQHGQVVFNDSASGGGGIIGGVYPGSTFLPGSVLAGFGITGQPAVGPFTVTGVFIAVNSNIVQLSIFNQNITGLQTGHVLQCAGFVNATFLNGQKLSVQTITVSTNAQGQPTYIVSAIGISTFAAGYAFTTDSGTVTAAVNDVLVTASGAAGVGMRPIYSGAFVGPLILSQVNHQYVLQTWIGAQAPTRYTRPYTNLTQSTTFGNNALAASGTLSWLVTDYDLGVFVIEQQNPLFGLFPAAPPPLVTKFTLGPNLTLPPFALYCLINGIDLNVSINYTDLSLPPDAFLTVQSLTGQSGGKLPWLPSQLSVPIHYQLGFGQVNQTAQVSQQGEAFTLSFYTDTIPSVGARIRFQSWAAAQSISRVRDPIAIANEAKVSGDSGVRAAIMQNLSPTPRNSVECEAAAGAAILDREFPQFQGNYTVQTIPGHFESLFAPSLYPFPRTGRFLYINAKVRGITGSNFIVTTVRTQVVEMRSEVMTISVDYGPDLYLEKLLPAFLEREQNLLVPTQTVAPPNPITLPQVLNFYLPNLDNARVTGIVNSLTGNYIQIDLGAPPVTACEVRNVDNGWGLANAGRVGLFTTQVFTVPRTSRSQKWFLRAVNGAAFSRFSKGLNVQYPLIPSSPGLVSNNAQVIVTALEGDTRDIYGLELRALSSSGQVGNPIVIQLPNTSVINPLGSLFRAGLPQSGFSGLAGTNAVQVTVPFNPPWPNDLSEQWNFFNPALNYIPLSSDLFQVFTPNQLPQVAPSTPPGYTFGDIVYVTCPTDASFNGFTVLVASAFNNGIPQYGSVDFGLPYTDLVGTYRQQVGTIQLVARGTAVVPASGSMLNSIVTMITRSPHNFVPGQQICVGCWWSGNPTASGTFLDGVTPWNKAANSVFSGTWTVLNVINATTFTYVCRNINIPSIPTAVQLTALNGAVAGIPLAITSSEFIPGAPPGTIVQKPIFSPADLVINLAQPDIANTLSIIESATPGSRVGGLALFFFNTTWDYSAPTPVPAFVVPSISGLVIDTNAQNLVWNINSGIPAGHRVETLDPITGQIQSKYTTDHPDNPQLLRRAFMTYADWQNPRSIRVTPFDALGDGFSATISWPGASGGGGGSFTLGGLPPALQGDIIRFNTEGDNAWDAVNYAQGFVGMIAQQDNVISQGATSNGVSSAPSMSHQNIFPNFYSSWGSNWFFSSPTLITSVSQAVALNGSNVQLPMYGFYKLTFRIAYTLNPNCRFWLGLANWNSGSTLGQNNVAITNTAAFATDTPNKSTIGFRYSPTASGGGDTTWKAIAVIPGVSPTMTVIDTGVAPINNFPFIFEIVPIPAGMNFYINYALVAFIPNSKLPAGNLNFDSLAGIFYTGDNKNTANTIGITFYYALMSLKGAQPGNF